MKELQLYSHSRKKKKTMEDMITIIEEVKSDLLKIDEKNTLIQQQMKDLSYDINNKFNYILSTSLFNKKDMYNNNNNTGDDIYNDGSNNNNNNNTDPAAFGFGRPSSPNTRNLARNSIITTTTSSSTSRPSSPNTKFIIRPSSTGSPASKRPDSANKRPDSANKRPDSANKRQGSVNISPSNVGNKPRPTMGQFRRPSTKK
jgi:hypothetical protein